MKVSFGQGFKRVANKVCGRIEGGFGAGDGSKFK